MKKESKILRALDPSHEEKLKRVIQRCTVQGHLNSANDNLAYDESASHLDSEMAESIRQWLNLYGNVTYQVTKEVTETLDEMREIITILAAWSYTYFSDAGWYDFSTYQTRERRIPIEVLTEDGHLPTAGKDEALVVTVNGIVVVSPKSLGDWGEFINREQKERMYQCDVIEDCGLGA